MKLLLKCKELAHLTSESRERALDWRERLMVRIHLVLCPPCVRFRRHMEFLRAAAKSPAAEGSATPGAKLADGARDRIRRNLDL
jgi:hypothetical protein